MPRPNRVLLAGYPHHVVQRGHDRQPVFACAADYTRFLSNLGEQLVERNVRVYGYCLMTNHVHLLLAPVLDGADISRLMRVVAARQTRYTNRLEGRTGTLWEGRFKCSLVDREGYLSACVRYVEENPVRAGIVSNPDQYPWSSAGQRHCSDSGIIELTPLPGFARGQNGGGAMDREQFAVIRTALQRNQVTGNDRFREAIAAKLGRRMGNSGPGRPRKRENDNARVNNKSDTF